MTSGPFSLQLEQLSSSQEYPSVLQTGLSVLSPRTSFPETPRGTNEPTLQVPEGWGERLANIVDRSLWRTDVLPPIGATITPEQGTRIQNAALLKTQAIWNSFSFKDKMQFGSLSPNRIIETPRLFNSLLLADRACCVAMLRELLPQELRLSSSVDVLDEASAELVNRAFAFLKTFPDIHVPDQHSGTIPEAFGDLTELKSLDIKGIPLIVNSSLCSLLARLRASHCTVSCDSVVEKGIKDLTGSS